ncbi:MAG: hypothetical protein WC557_12395 [Ignavibacteriaceae bacterium]
MLTFRKKEKVINKMITIDIPENFGNEIEVIIISDADEKRDVLERIGNCINKVTKTKRALAI